MGDKSAIEWTDVTWNPIRARNRVTGRLGWHCEPVSEGCKFCYAGTMNAWRGTGLAYKPGHRDDIEIILDETVLLRPLRWARSPMIFVCSMTDLFASFVPDAMIDRIFAVMALSPQHTFQVLTKRPERMRAYVSRICNRDDLIAEAAVQAARAAAGRLKYAEDMPNLRRAISVMVRSPLPNVWLGTSCEDQATADARVPDLLATPASIRFVSAEPLLGGIDFAGWLGEPNDVACPGCDDDHSGGRKHCSRLDIPRDQQCPNKRAVFDYEEGALDEDGAPSAIAARRIILDWIIGGGESGRSARPMHPDWVRSIRDQCAAAGVAFFFKQWGEWAPSDAVGIVGDGPITDRRGNVQDWMNRYVVADGDAWAARVRGHSFTRHATNLVYRFGKRRAGRMLDGVTHDGMPEVRT